MKGIATHIKEANVWVTGVFVKIPSGPWRLLWLLVLIGKADLGGTGGVWCALGLGFSVAPWVDVAAGEVGACCPSWHRSVFTCRWLQKWPQLGNEGTERNVCGCVRA